MADGSTSQRQHPAWIVIGAVRSLRAFALPLAILLVTGGREGEAWFLAVGGALALVGVAGRTVEWWRFRYEVSERELRVRSGVLARRERSVPLERIQAVDVAESPLQRAFGVVGVRIETAAGGAGAADVVLEAVSRAEAESLRQRLVARRAEPAPPAVDGATAPTAAVGPGAGELVRALSPRDLLLAGATSGRIGPALAVISFGFQLLDDVVPDWFWERVAMSAPAWSVRGVLSVVLVVGVGAWLLAVASTVLTYGGFELRRDGDRLLIRYGLLDRRRSTIPLARVQAVTMTEGVLRQPLGLAALSIESAGYGRGATGSGVLFPLLPRAAVPALLAAACPAFAAPLDDPALAGPPPRARRRYALAGVWPVLVLTAAALAVSAVAPWWGWRWGLLPLAAAPFAALLGLLRFRDAGWALDEAERLIVRGRTVPRTTTVTLRRRLQHRHVRQHLLQRRARLATFAAVVASGGEGGRVAVEHLDEAVAFDLLDRLGPASTRPTAPTVTGAAPVVVPQGTPGAG